MGCRKIEDDVLVLCVSVEMRHLKRLQSLMVAGTQDANFHVVSPVLIGGKWQFVVSIVSCFLVHIFATYADCLSACKIAAKTLCIYALCITLLQPTVLWLLYRTICISWHPS